MKPRNLLAPREMKVAVLVWQGMTNRNIADSLGTTEQVVKNYLRTIFDKLGVWSRLELALYVASHGGDSWNEDLVSKGLITKDESNPEDAAQTEMIISEQRAG